MLLEAVHFFSNLPGKQLLKILVLQLLLSPAVSLALHDYGEKVQGSQIHFCSLQCYLRQYFQTSIQVLRLAVIQDVVSLVTSSITMLCNKTRYFFYSSQTQSVAGKSYIFGPWTHFA